MKKIILLALIGIVFVLSACAIQSIMLKKDSSQIQINNNPDTNIDLSTNPNYCQVDDDCISVSNPSNRCYFGYFNKNATAAIEKFKNISRMMIQDCPNFGKVYCNTSANKCTAKRLD